ncbi:hypothetical protein [Streptomyces sp. NPDC049040]|uniref:hypothetical protein n=1 Tax=Streptomyces sp. NPDC049040 TaxID=3365593 RepID=UPI00372045CE
MAKHRMTLTLEAEEEEAIRAAADAMGLDLSAFLRIAALAEVARMDRVTQGFAEIDRLNQAAEEAPAADMPESSPEQTSAVDAFLDAADAEAARRTRGAAA